MSSRPSLLFPSANSVKKSDRDDVDVTAESEDVQCQHIRLGPTSASDNLNWLTNKSFRSDNAVAIAKQHLRKRCEVGHGDDVGIPPSLPQEIPDGSDSSVDSDSNHSVNSSSGFKILPGGLLESQAQPQGSPSKKRKHKRDYDESVEKHRKKRHHRDKHHRGKKKKHSKKRRRNEHDSSDESNGSDICKDATRLKETASASDVFRIDVKSDRNNLCFDRLHFTDTVAYYRLGHSCLGLDSRHQSVTWRDAKAKKKHKVESDRVRYFTPGYVYSEEDGIAGSMDLGTSAMAKQKMLSGQEAVSYIPIDHLHSHTKPDFDPLGIYDPSTQAYLGSVPQPNPAKPQTGYQLAPAIGVHSSFTKTTAFYNRHLHENPHDVPKWLEFVNFQDTAEYDGLVSTGSGQSNPDADTETKQKGRKKSIKMISEKKLAILDKALLHNPGSIALQLEQLRIGKEFWDASEQTRQWEKLLKSNPDDVRLWREYLLFKQACFSTFSVSKVAGSYGKCFGKLVARHEELDGPEAADMENELLDLFVGLCHFWRQAGHTEKAVAAFQVMVELNCFCPPQFQQDTHLEGQIAFLETFWDSSEPRVGEKGAKSWASWMKKKERGGWEQVKIPEADETPDEPSSQDVISSDQPLWQAWLCEEVFREGNNFAPWRPNEAKGETEEDCEDPERMVLFDDISQVLFRLGSWQKQFQLVLLFLDFLGISVPRRLMQYFGEVADSSRLYLDQPSQMFPPASDCLTFSSICTPSLTPTGVAGNCRSLEQAKQDLESTKKTNIKDSRTENKPLEEFVEEFFSQITPVFPEAARTQLLLMRLDFRMQRALVTSGDKQQRKKRLKEAKRFAKALLSQEENRNNLHLWAALARWEQWQGNTEEAKRVLQTALHFLGLPQTNTHKRAAARLAQTFTDLCVGFDLKSPSPAVMNSGNMEALHILTTLAEGTVFSPLKDIPGQSVSATRILKARRNYQELTTETLASLSVENNESQDVDSAEPAEWCQPQGSYMFSLTNCFAIFQYLTVGMQAASVVFESSLSALKRGGSAYTNSNLRQQLRVDQELLTVSHVKLLSSHVYSNPCPLGALRNLIKTSLVDFPSNPTLLDAFIYSETKSHIAGRVRRYFDRATRQANDPTLWLFAIRAELLRQEAIVTASTAAGVKGLPVEVSFNETGISNRIRSLFDRACECQHSRHCVLLWRMYMQFEIQQGNLKRAESIFYNALQHCPWAKVIYVDAVRYFPSKLQDCQDLLMEKELRIRAPLEEVELLTKNL